MKHEEVRKNYPSTFRKEFKVLYNKKSFWVSWDKIVRVEFTCQIIEKILTPWCLEFN